MIEEEERRVRESGGQDYDMLLKNNIEGIIIKWAYQVLTLIPTAVGIYGPQVFETQFSKPVLTEMHEFRTIFYRSQ